MQRRNAIIVLLIGMMLLLVYLPTFVSSEHYVQYPDPAGWDVYFGTVNGLADDWLCNSSGNVTGIHLWVSSEGDSANLSNIQYEFDPYLTTLSIYNNNATYPSHPGDLLWNVDPMGGITYDLNVSGPFSGDEGWYDPYTGYYAEHDHTQFWRVDLTNITNPFYQESGNVYWLNIAVPSDYTIGWKTSSNHFMDNAVNSSFYDWYPMEDPINASQLDFAFVITGEPALPPPVYGDNTTFANIKMTNPQYPDPFGWDVAWGPNGYSYTFLADDWVCNQSGNITGIHFWVSTYNDTLVDIQSLFTYPNFDVGVFHNDPNPPGNYSQPVYESPWLPYLGYECTVNVSGPYNGDEGWFTVDGGDYQQHNHAQFWRVDITDFTGAYNGLFHQEAGQTYWLAIISRAGLADTHVLGWKTTASHFMDNAVWSNEYLYSDWQPIVDPINSSQIDLAFVITGEAPLPPTINYPPVFSNENPINGSIGQPLSLNWSVDINDLEGDAFDWAIVCSNGQAATDDNVYNGTETLSLSGLLYSTEYTVWVNATDYGSGLTTSEWFTFTTESIQYGDNTTFPNAKMTTPQYPNPFGWDVAWGAWNIPFLSDDWVCNFTGYVTGIHFWVSSFGDSLSPGDILNLVNGSFIAISDNNLGMGYSYPEDIIWILGSHTTNISGPFLGDEGWLIPDDSYNLHNHQLFWRIDITNISDPFRQVNGTVYWLNIGVFPVDEYRIGWKTTAGNNYMDAAVYGEWRGWYPLQDPLTMMPADLAFVITGGLPTYPPWDINQDGTVNYLDVSALVSHYGESGAPGWIPEDINSDGFVNYLDVSALVSHYGEHY